MAIVNDNVDLKGGWKGLSYSTPLEGMQEGQERALVGDHDCPENRLFGLSTAAFKRHETHGWKFSQDIIMLIHKFFNQLSKLLTNFFCSFFLRGDSYFLPFYFDNNF